MECSVEHNLVVSKGPAPQVEPEFCLRPLGLAKWTAASGRQLEHTVFSLTACPAIAAAIYLLVQRKQSGKCRVLAIRGTRNTAAPSLNLARLRRTGARMGATEVHIYTPKGSDDERRVLVADLALSLLKPGTSEIRSRSILAAGSSRRAWRTALRQRRQNAG
jgi:hypothetical protein